MRNRLLYLALTLALLAAIVLPVSRSAPPPVRTLKSPR